MHIVLSEREFAALLELAASVVEALHVGKDNLGELLPMYHWASDMLEWESDLRAWSEDAGNNIQLASNVADALLNRFAELEQARRTSEENQALQTMASDEELRRLADLNALAESGTDTEQMLHGLISRYDQVRSKLELMYKKCAVVTSTGAKGGPRGWSVRSLELEELYLFLKESLTSGERLENVATQLSERIQRISEEASRHGAEIVGLLLDIHLSEDELIALKRHIDMLVNGMELASEAAEGKSYEGQLSVRLDTVDMGLAEREEPPPQIEEWRSHRVQEIAETLDAIETRLLLEESEFEESSSKGAEDFEEEAVGRSKRHQEQLVACRLGLDILMQHEQKLCEDLLARGEDPGHMSPSDERASRESAARAIITRYESDHKRLLAELERDRMNQRRRVERRLNSGRAADGGGIEKADARFRSYLEASGAACLQDCLTALAVVFSDRETDRILPEIEDALSAGKMLHEEIALALQQENYVDDAEHSLLPVRLVNEAFVKVVLESSSKGTEKKRPRRPASDDLLSRMRSVVVRSSWEEMKDSETRDKLAQISNQLSKSEEKHDSAGLGTELVESTPKLLSTAKRVCTHSR